MKTLKIELYKFEELSKEAKENAIANYIEKNKDSITEMRNYMFQDCLPDELQYLEYSFTPTNFSYSLSYCQGDGLSFTFELDLEEYLNKYFSYLKDSEKNVITNYAVFESKPNNRYCYAASSQVDLYLDNSIYDKPNIEELINKVRIHLEDNYIDICGRLEKQGYREIYDWADDKHFIIDEIENEEHDKENPIFLKDGTIY